MTSAFTRGSPGTGCITGFAALGGLVATAVVLAPGTALLAAGLEGWSPGLLLGPLVPLASASAALAGGLQVAAAYAEPRQAELLAAVSPGQA